MRLPLLVVVVAVMAVTVVVPGQAVLHVHLLRLLQPLLSLHLLLLLSPHHHTPEREGRLGPNDEWT